MFDDVARCAFDNGYRVAIHTPIPTHVATMATTSNIFSVDVRMIPEAIRDMVRRFYFIVEDSGSEKIIVPDSET